MEDKIKHPKMELRNGGLSSLVQPSDKALLSFFPSYNWKGVTVTDEQRKKVFEWLGIDVKDISCIEEAGASVNAMKHASFHGLRLLLFLAGNNLLEEGDDPVEWLSGVLANNGYDVEPWE